MSPVTSTALVNHEVLDLDSCLVMRSRRPCVLSSRRYVPGPALSAAAVRLVRLIWRVRLRWAAAIRLLPACARRDHDCNSIRHQTHHLLFTGPAWQLAPHS
jgi:hypothetical protein